MVRWGAETRPDKRPGEEARRFASTDAALARLDQLLARAACLLQQELENRSALFATLIEPALLLFMGGTVLVIVLAVMQPIIEINTLMK